MQAIQTFEDVAKLALEEFVRLHPNPFLVHSGGPMRSVDRSKTRGLTVDRIVLEGNTPSQQPHAAASFLVAEVVAREPDRKGLVTIGVSSTCDVQINDQSLSKVHAWFERTGDGWRVWDNESVAGTQVNDKPLKRGFPHSLVSGDRITFGYVDIMFLPAEAFHRLIVGLLR